MAIVVTEENLVPAQLQEQLRGKVSSFAVPSRWRLQREALLTNHTGKVDKKAISAQAIAEHQQAIFAGKD